MEKETETEQCVLGMVLGKGHLWQSCPNYGPTLDNLKVRGDKGPEAEKSF